MITLDTVSLSILICTIPERSKSFIEIHRELFKQITYCQTTHPTLGKVQVCVNNDIKYLHGGPSIGEKRGALLKEAKGMYVCFLDDDESISPDYVETLLRLCYEEKDVCTFRSLSKLKNNWALIDMSIANENEQINPFGITRRAPWHVCPIRTEIAKSYQFPISNYGEDWIWVEKVLKECVTEAHTDKIIHQYNHGDHSEADKIK